MKIAVATEGNRVSRHFGRCEKYIAYEVEDNEIVHKTEIEHPGHRPGFLPRYLSKKEVDLLITGGIGPRAINMFNSLGIDVMSGIQGTVDEVIQQYLKEELEGNVEPCEEHNSHSHSKTRK